MLRALQSRNYRLFFCGQLVSLMGSWMTQIATSWLVYRITGSSLMLGLVAFAGQLPAFLLGPIAGVWVDRLPRHRLLVVTQSCAMVQSFGLAAMAFSGRISIPLIIALLVFQGIINAFDMPTRQSFVVEMLENPADLPNAIALNSSMVNLARLLGPSIGGILIAAAGEKWCFLLDGFSYLGVIISLLLMKIVPRAVKARVKNPLQELREGFGYAFGFAPIRSLLLVMASMSLMGMPYAVMMPVVARESLGGGPKTLGFLMAASGLGALCAALTLAARRSVRGLMRQIPFCTLSFGVAVAAFSQISTLWLALPLLFGMGFAMMTQHAACNTLLQTIVESDKRGRVMSLYSMAFIGLAPFGSLWAGALAHQTSVAVTLLVCAGGSLMAGAWFSAQLPSLRADVAPIYRKLGILPEVALGEENELGVPPSQVG